MQPASEHHIPDGLLASMTLLSEKPRHGVTSWESAPQSGINEANSTTAIGLRFRCWEIASDPVDAPNNAQQIAKTCIDQFNDTGVGKFVNFWSMASPLIGPDRWGSLKEDVGGSTLKFGAYQFFKGASKTMVRTPFGSMSGFVAETIETVAADVVLPLAVAATGTQVLMHAGCYSSAYNATGQANIPVYVAP